MICCGYPNYNAQGALVIIFFICSDLQNCLRSLCTVAIRTGNEKEKENPHCKRSFCCFDVFPVRPTQKFQVQAKIPTIRPVFLDYFSVSYDYPVKLQTCVTKRLFTTFHQLKMIYGNVRILLLLNLVVKLKINPANLSTKKEGVRVGRTLFKVK